MPADVAGTAKAVEALKASVQKGDLGAAQTQLNKLKVRLEQHQSCQYEC